jgi:hypothetical protein
MFAFKGLVADILFAWFPLDGTQLQHLLGNLFKHDILDRIFAYYDMERLVRHGSEFEVEKHRHIFVYGLLGFVYAHSPEATRTAFIQTHFLLPHAHLFVANNKQQDLEAQANALAKMLYGCALSVKVEQAENKRWHARVLLDQEALAEDDSVGYRYSRQKALKKALLVLVERAQQADRTSATYEQRQQQLEELRRQKIEAAKNEKLLALRQKEADKRAKRERVRALRAEAKLLRDNNRKQAKAKHKLRQQQESEKAARAAAQMATMSANKRRHLEDKAK